MKENKITYIEGDNIRVIRGIVEGANGENIFVTVKRMDGTVKINRNHIVKIETEGP